MSALNIILTGLRATWIVAATFCALNYSFMAAFCFRQWFRGHRVPFSTQLALGIFLASIAGLFFATMQPLWDLISVQTGVAQRSAVGIAVLIVALWCHNLAKAGANERPIYGWYGVIAAITIGLLTAGIVAIKAHR